MPAGTRLTCSNPQCRVKIARLRYDIIRQPPGIDPRWFEFGAGQQREVGAPALCHHCGTAFIRQLYTTSEPGIVTYELHTEDGWFALK